MIARGRRSIIAPEREDILKRKRKSMNLLYQSGKLSLSGAYSHMEKRGSRYLRYALYNATKYVCLWDPTFAAYLAKKRAEGKHYNVAISHAAKKLVRLIYAMEKSGQPYCSAT